MGIPWGLIHRAGTGMEKSIPITFRGDGDSIFSLELVWFGFGFDDLDSISVWFLALLAYCRFGKKNLHYRFEGPEEVPLLSEWRLLRKRTISSSGG